MTKVEEERIKMMATALSNLSVATIAAGILAPTIAFLYGTGATNTNGWWFLVGVVWLLAGGALYSLAWMTLGRLR